jgi:predicted dehydrogenase
MRWGIIGLGKIARKFAEDLRSLPGAELHAVASISSERAASFAREFDVPNVFHRYEDLACCSGLDVVYIATPHPMHFPNTMLCLEQGIAVLCEKPFSMNFREAQAMASKAAEKKVFLMEALWSTFVPAVSKAIEMARSGQIGELKMLRADLGFHNEYRANSRLFDLGLGGGSLLDLGIYPVWLALKVFGKPSDAQISTAASFSPSGSDETCVFTFNYGNGRVFIGHSTVAVTTGLEAQIFGEKGNIRLHPRWHHTQKLTLTLQDGQNSTQEDINLPYQGHGYAFEAAHVMECIGSGYLESPLHPLRDSLDLVETLDTIRQKIGLVYLQDIGN